jgi:hypothetical protein
VPELGSVETMVRNDHEVSPLAVDVPEYPSKDVVAPFNLVLVFRALTAEGMPKLVRV